MPWQWSAWSWVTITRSTRSTSGGVASARAGRGRNRPAGVSPPLSIRIDERRRRLRGSAGSQSPQSLPIRGTPDDVPQPRIADFTRRLCRTSGRSWRVVRSASSSKLVAAQAGDESARCRRRRPARTVLPRCGTGARNGASVSTSSRSCGNGLRGFLQVAGVLEGHDPRQRDVEAEVERGVGELRRCR